MAGSGFLAGTTSPAKTANRAATSGADDVLEHRPHRLLGRGRGDGQRPAGVQRLVDDAGDARAAGQAPGRDHAPCRCAVLRLCQAASSSLLPVGVGGQAVPRRRTPSVSRLAIRSLPPPISQLSAVLLLGPAHRQAGLGEGLVERGQVAVRARCRRARRRSRRSARARSQGRGVVAVARRTEVRMWSLGHLLDRAADVAEQRRRVVLAGVRVRGTRGASRMNAIFSAVEMLTLAQPRRDEVAGTGPRSGRCRRAGPSGSGGARRCR